MIAAPEDIDARTFAPRLIEWWHRSGRKDLPWQIDRTPYRVWVSEIMLQQTQVATAADYFRAFTTRWPDVPALAAAGLDDVLHAWSGLGYYSRARNLHRAARCMVAEHDGRLPDTLDALVDLPGIGRSTAGAILALGHGTRGTILDGNVKRVLTRHLGVEEWPGRAPVERALWGHAEARTPSHGAAIYTQAIMDLGATLCRRTRPLCEVCPVAADCRARIEHRQTEIPAPRPKRQVPEREVLLWAIRKGDDVWLERRAESGIWGGLWSLPEAPVPGETTELSAHFRQTAPAPWRDLEILDPAPLAPVRHTFTHFRLHMTPVIVPLAAAAGSHPVGENAGEGLWYNGAQSVGLPAPIGRLLGRLAAGPVGAP